MNCHHYISSSCLPAVLTEGFDSEYEQNEHHVIILGHEGDSDGAEEVVKSKKEGKQKSGGKKEKKMHKFELCKGLWQEVEKRLQKDDRIVNLGANNRSYWAATFQQLRSEWYNPIDQVIDKSGRNWIDNKLQLSEEDC